MRPCLRARRGSLRLNRQLQSETSQMADREMIAATLAAALIVGRNSSSTRTSVEQLAVETFQRVLAALDAAAPARQPLTR